MDLKNYWDGDAVSKNIDKIKNVFFYRVCGMGMGTCAKLMKEAGYNVEGADSMYFPPMSLYLKEAEIPCFDLKDVDGDFLKKYDLVIVGNSVGGKSEEARMIEAIGIPFTSFPTFMGETLLKNKNVIGIAGTHGKTTTTYYMTQILDKLGKKPGHFVGGVLLDRPPAVIGEGEYFVIESDEYDSSYFQKIAKFRQYFIKNLVLTSLEFDHADIYADTDAIESEFHHILDKVETFTGNSDYPCVQNVAKKYGKDVSYYGEKSDFGPHNVEYKDGSCFFVVNYGGKEHKIQTNTIGLHNILNLSACLLFCFEEGFDIEAVKKAVLEIKNVKRRQEYRGLYQNSIVIDDFAHHPTSVALTIDTIKKRYPGKPIHAFIEPSTSTNRSTAFKDTFIPSFEGATSVTVANPKLPTNAKQFENLDYQKLSDDIGAQLGVKTAMVESLEELRRIIDEASKEDSVLLFMGNRTILGLWQSDFVGQLK